MLGFFHQCLFVWGLFFGFGSGVVFAMCPDGSLCAVAVPSTIVLLLFFPRNQVPFLVLEYVSARVVCVCVL